LEDAHLIAIVQDSVIADCRAAVNSRTASRRYEGEHSV